MGILGLLVVFVVLLLHGIGNETSMKYCDNLVQTIRDNESDMAQPSSEITKSSHKRATRDYHVNTYLYQKKCGEM